MTITRDPSPGIDVEDADWKVLRTRASDPDSDPDSLAALTEHKNYLIRSLVAKNPSLPHDARKSLAERETNSLVKRALSEFTTDDPLPGAFTPESGGSGGGLSR
jgi:hypothetical protein